MTDPETFKRLRKLADALIASCDGGRDYVDDIEGLSLDECRVLDSMALECTSCNQWYSTADMTSGVCKDCDAEDNP